LVIGPSLMRRNSLWRGSAGVCRQARGIIALAQFAVIGTTDAVGVCTRVKLDS
jgi:hypothetical protein